MQRVEGEAVRVDKRKEKEEEEIEEAKTEVAE